jgi:hypothetical protein
MALLRAMPPVWSWPLVMAVVVLLCAALAAAILDVGLLRQRGGSVTTEMPGYVYASATVMKIWVMGSVLLCLGWRGKGGAALGVFSLLSGPLALPMSALFVIGWHALVKEPGAAGVHVLMGLLAAGGAIGLLGMLRREGALAVLGFVLNLVVLGLCWYFQFYAVGFSQDGWAPRAF